MSKTRMSQLFPCKKHGASAKMGQSQIQTYEKSLKELEKEWGSIKRNHATSQLDPQVRDKQLHLIRLMKNDLVGIVDVLQQAGFYLDDHYLTVRSLILQL